ncbi:unnamed protein product, partial [Allacma fusca]
DSDLECLALVGAAKDTSDEFAESIKSDLAASWNLIATAGLSEKKRTDIEKMRAPPSNCLLVGAPKLNPKLRAGINISD